MAKFDYNGKTYDLVMSLYAMEKIEDEFGDISEALKKFRSRNRNVKMIKSMFRILANAALHEKQQPETVTGREIDGMGRKGLESLSTALRNAMDESLKAETVNGGLGDDVVADGYAEELERQEQEKNASAGGGSAPGNTTGTP